MKKTVKHVWANNQNDSNTKNWWAKTICDAEENLAIRSCCIVAIGLYVVYQNIYYGFKAVKNIRGTENV
jgi:hypothetical protein